MGRGRGSFVNDRIVELYRYPDGWWVGRIVDADELIMLPGEGTLQARSWFRTGEVSTWFVLVDKSGTYRDVFIVTETSRIPLSRRIERWAASRPWKEEVLWPIDRRWVAFFVDMAFGQIPDDVEKIASIPLPVVIPSGVDQAVDRPLQEAKLAGLRVHWRHHLDDDELHDQIRDLGNDIVENSLGRFWPVTRFDQAYLPSTTINVHLRFDFNVDDLNITPYDEDTHQWSMMVSDYDATVADHLYGSTLAELWQEFIHYMKTQWNQPVLDQESAELWWDELPWGAPMVEIDFEFYELIDAVSPVVLPIKPFIEWARVKGLM